MLRAWVCCVCPVLSCSAATAAKSLQSCPTLCDPIDGSSPGSPIHGILQARTLEWVAISFSNLVAQSCPTLCNPRNYNSPVSSVHGDSPGKNTGVGYHALLQGIFPTQGSNPCLLYCRWIFTNWANRDNHSIQLTYHNRNQLILKL